MRTRSTYCTDKVKKRQRSTPKWQGSPLLTPGESMETLQYMHVAECNFQKVSFTRDGERIRSSRIH